MGVSVTETISTRPQLSFLVKSFRVRQLCMSAPLTCSLHLLDHSHRATTFLTLARPFVLHSLRPLRHSSCHPSMSPLRRIPPPAAHSHPLISRPKIRQRGLTLDATSPPFIPLDLVWFWCSRSSFVLLSGYPLYSLCTRVTCPLFACYLSITTLICPTYSLA